MSGNWSFLLYFGILAVLNFVCYMKLGNYLYLCAGVTKEEVQEYVSQNAVSSKHRMRRMIRWMRRNTPHPKEFEYMLFFCHLVSGLCVVPTFLLGILLVNHRYGTIVLMGSVLPLASTAAAILGFRYGKKVEQRFLEEAKGGEARATAPGILGTVLRIVSVAVSIVILLLGLVQYELNYRIRRIDESRSPDGTYSIELQSVGSPFLFGSADGRLLLKMNEKKIAYYDFVLRDDGGSVGESSWQVEWKADEVQVTISGSEQEDEVIEIGFNGNIRSEKESPAAESEGIYPTEEGMSEEEFEAYEEESRKEQTMEYLQIEDGYKAVYHSVFREQDKTFIETFDAKGNSRFILYEDDTVIEYLTYDRFSKNGECRLYVYYRCEKAEDGSWSAMDAEILDIYAYVVQNGEVIGSGKRTWQDSGTEEYQSVTGEA